MVPLAGADRGGRAAAANPVCTPTSSTARRGWGWCRSRCASCGVVAGRRLPAIPTTESFSEVNGRTYVTGPEGPGVWFDTLDASSWLGSPSPVPPGRCPTCPPASPAPRPTGPGAGMVDRPVRRHHRPGRRRGRRPAGRRRAPRGVPHRALRPLRPVVVVGEAGAVGAGGPCPVGAALVREGRGRRRAGARAGYPVDDTPVHVVAADSVGVRIGLPKIL